MVGNRYHFHKFEHEKTVTEHTKMYGIDLKIQYSYLCTSSPYGYQRPFFSGAYCTSGTPAWNASVFAKKMSPFGRSKHSWFVVVSFKKGGNSAQMHNDLSNLSFLSSITSLISSCLCICFQKDPPRVSAWNGECFLCLLSVRWLGHVMSSKY